MAGMMDIDPPLATDDRIIEVAFFDSCNLFKGKEGVMLAKIVYFSSCLRFPFA